MRTTADKLEWLMRVIEHPKSSTQAATVAVALANAFNCKTKQCNPSISTLSRLTNLGQRTVYRALDNLAENGLIHRISTVGHKNSFDLTQPRINTEQTPVKSDTRVKSVTSVKSDTTPLSNLTKIEDPLLIDETVNRNITPPIVPPGGEPPSDQAVENLDSEAWSDLHEYRTTHKVKKVRDSWTPLAQKKAAKLLSELTPESQRQCVDLTIANGWQGIFPDKLKNNGNRYAKQLTQSEINGRVTDELFGRNVDEPFGSDLFFSLRTPLEGNTQNAGRGEAEIIDLGARLRIGKS